MLYWNRIDYSMQMRETSRGQDKKPIVNNYQNVGNIGGDGPAHYRYTEARLAKITEDGLLSGLKKKNVPFQLTFDETNEEPITLPSIFPNLLCNPNMGIGVAMAASWACHNLGEVANAIYDYLDGKEPMLPGPDFPGGGLIINKDDIPAIMRTGRGSVKIRGQYKIEKQNIVFYEIPYGVSTEAVMTEIGKLADDKEIEGIAHIRDESNKKGMRLVIECEKTANPEAIVKQLFIKSDLQSSFSYNQVALVDKVPTELNLKQCVAIYVKHNIECLIKECNFDLQKTAARKEVVDGLLRALADIDDIIVLIKKSTNASTAKDNLVKVYKFTEAQAKAIVDMKLGKIASLEKIELEEEKAELEKTIAEIQNILASEDNQKAEIRNRLAALVKKYGDKRRTELAQIEVPKAEKEIEEVVPEDCVVVMSRTGDIKRVPTSSFKVQHRNGKGVKTIDDTMLDVISTNTIDTLMIFTDKGKMYRLLVDKVPAGTNVSKGTNIVNLIKCEPNEKAIAVTSLYRQSSAKYVVFITKQGLFKKTPLSEYTQTSRNVGLAAIKLVEGDSLANVTFAEDEEFLIVTKKGLTIRFESALVTPIGRVSQGVKGVKLAEGDEVIVGLPIHKKTDNLAVFFDKGTAKKVALEEFPIQGRGGKGVLVTKGASITGDIVGAALVEDSDNLLIMGKPNSICIAAKDIPLTGRPASGNLMLKGSVVTAAVKI